MLNRKQSITAGVTVFIALGTAHMMQVGVAGASRSDAALNASVGIALSTPSIEISPLDHPGEAAVVSTLPERASSPAKPRSRMIAVLARPDDDDADPSGDAVITLNSSGMSCDPELTVSAERGAMVHLELLAGCYPETRFDIELAGITFSADTDANGRLAIHVPALASPALFAATADGAGTARASAVIPDLAAHDRVALQSRAGDGLAVHALEFGARPGRPGHISASDPHGPMRGLLAYGGFLTRLGTSTDDEAQIAEIYSFPSGLVTRSGVVRLQIEANVTEANCGRAVDALAVQTRRAGDLRAVSLSVSLPGCDAVGDTLVLKNILQDLKIARN